MRFYPLPKSLTLIVMGSVLVVGSLVWYQAAVVGPSIVETGKIGVLELVAYSVVGIVLAGLLMLFFGLTIYIRKYSVLQFSEDSSFLTRLSTSIFPRRSVRILAITAIGYGLFFAIVSSTLVFQPGVRFSQLYGVQVPSIEPVVCCGAFGQLPQLVIYITQQFAILLIPENLILLFVVSWLVGLNSAVAKHAYGNRPRATGARWFSGLGAVIALFSICPTCAGFFLMTMIGLGGALGLALTISTLQTVFIAIGIPALILAPILALQKISAKSCFVKEKSLLLR